MELFRSAQLEEGADVHNSCKGGAVLGPKRERTAVHPSGKQLPQSGLEPEHPETTPSQGFAPGVMRVTIAHLQPGAVPHMSPGVCALIPQLAQPLFLLRLQ